MWIEIVQAFLFWKNLKFSMHRSILPLYYVENLHFRCSVAVLGRSWSPLSLVSCLRISYWLQQRETALGANVRT